MGALFCFSYDLKQEPYGTNTVAICLTSYLQQSLLRVHYSKGYLRNRQKVRKWTRDQLQN